MLPKTIRSSNRLVNQAIFDNKSKHIVINQNKTNVSIDDVRQLTETLSYGSYEGAVQTVIIYHADQATLPAQNALLKLLEEPPIKTQLFLTVENMERLLETILSRCTVIYASKNDVENNDYDALLYEKAYSHLRASSFREVIDEASKYSDRSEALTFLQQLLIYLHSQLEKDPANAQLRIANGEVHSAIGLLEKNVNTKLVLENCFIKLKTHK
jgi:DNA polymerase III delta prime subunit